MATTEPDHPGPPPSPDEGRVAADAWRHQWRVWRAWRDAQDRAARAAAPTLGDDLSPQSLTPRGWAWRSPGCKVSVPDTRKTAPPQWTQPFRFCDRSCVAFVETLGGLLWWGVCARHFAAARAAERGWRWAHDASLVSMTPPDEVENWLALYALGLEP